MEPLGAPAVERQAPEQDHPRNRVRGLREAGAREIVEDEALGAEAGEQALRDALLEVEMDRVLGEDAGVLEDDRPDRRLTAPVGELLVLPAGRAQRVEGGGPARVGLGAAIEARKAPHGGAMLVAALLEALDAKQFQGAREGVAEGCRLESDPVAGRLQQAPAALDLRLQLGVPPHVVDVDVRRLDLAREPIGVAVADALPETTLDVIVDHLGEAAQLLLDGLGLRDEDLEHPVLDALRKNEVVTAHFLGRLELAVDTAVALLDAAGVPGEVEVEEVRAVRLEVQALAGGVGGKEDAQRVPGGFGVEPALDLLTAGAAREAVDHLDAPVGPLGTLDGLLEDLFQMALRAFAVLGEDQDAALVPLRRRARRPLPERRKFRAQPGADPVDEAAGLGVRQVSRPLRDLLHPVEEPLLPAPERFRRGVPGRLGFGRRRHRLDGGVLLGLLFLRGPLGALVVGVRCGGEEG